MSSRRFGSSTSCTGEDVPVKACTGRGLRRVRGCARIRASEGCCVSMKALARAPAGAFSYRSARWHVDLFGCMAAEGAPVRGRVSAHVALVKLLAAEAPCRSRRTRGSGCS